MRDGTEPSGTASQYVRAYKGEGLGLWLQGGEVLADVNIAPVPSSLYKHRLYVQGHPWFSRDPRACLLRRCQARNRSHQRQMTALYRTPLTSLQGLGPCSPPRAPPTAASAASSLMGLPASPPPSRSARHGAQKKSPLPPLPFPLPSSPLPSPSRSPPPLVPAPAAPPCPSSQETWTRRRAPCPGPACMPWNLSRSHQPGPTPRTTEGPPPWGRSGLRLGTDIQSQTLSDRHSVTQTQSWTLSHRHSVTTNSHCPVSHRQAVTENQSRLVTNYHS